MLHRLGYSISNHSLGWPNGQASHLFDALKGRVFNSSPYSTGILPTLTSGKDQKADHQSYGHQVSHTTHGKPQDTSAAAAGLYGPEVALFKRCHQGHKRRFRSLWLSTH